MAKLLRAAVIGEGNMGCNHARVYVEMDDVLFAAAADPDQDTLRKMANTLEAECHKLMMQDSTS